MTENKAIKHLQSYAEVVDNMIKYCKDFEPKADITGYLVEVLKVKGDLVSRKFLLDCAEYDSNGRLIIPYKDVEKAPTAYDKEKVIDELEKLAGIARLSGDYNKNCVINAALRIIKQGGLN